MVLFLSKMYCSLNTGYNNHAVTVVQFDQATITMSCRCTIAIHVVAKRLAVHFQAEVVGPQMP